jgi:hypothetical protein
MLALHKVANQELSELRPLVLPADPEPEGLRISPRCRSMARPDQGMATAAHALGHGRLPGSYEELLAAR